MVPGLIAVVHRAVSGFMTGSVGPPPGRCVRHLRGSVRDRRRQVSANVQRVGRIGAAQELDTVRIITVRAFLNRVRIREQDAAATPGVWPMPQENDSSVEYGRSGHTRFRCSTREQDSHLTWWEMCPVIYVVLLDGRISLVRYVECPKLTECATAHPFVSARLGSCELALSDPALARLVAWRREVRCRIPRV